jgi:2-keto-4-pentenoate hydratase/2-oxohepta-3-ene-1,7-dioic acid hydratase in catechol pathway
MRIVQYESRGTVGCGVEAGGHVHATGYKDTLALIRDGERGLEAAAAAAEGAEPVAVDRILAPLTNPGKIFGSGVNYASHGDEEPGFVFPDEKVIVGFIKLASSIVGPDAEIVIPPYDDVIRRVPGDTAGPLREHGFAVDYEVELGVVLGTRAKHVRAEEALDHIFGYTVINDVGSRSVQFHNAQVDLGKNFDTFCPMGPCIVTRLGSHPHSVARQRRTAPGHAGRRAAGAASRRHRVALLGDHARAGRHPFHGDARRLRHVHGPASVPAARRHCHRVGERDRRAHEPCRAGHGANARVTASQRVARLSR